MAGPDKHPQAEHNPVTEQLRTAFLVASYGTPDERFRLAVRPGGPCRLFAPGEHWAILTAHNRHGVRQDAGQNERQQRQLELDLSGFDCQRAVNGEGEWAEASVLARAITLRQALDLGRRHGQAAVLWGSGQRAALVWCRPPSVPGPSGLPARAERFWVCLSERETARSVSGQ